MARPASYHVQSSPEPFLVFRVIRGGRFDATCFMSNREMGFPRRSDEDWLLYLGLSVRGTLTQALSVARSLARAQAAAKSSLPPPTHVALVAVHAEDGHVYAKTLGTRGHFTIWGDSGLWPSRIVRSWTIQGVEV